ncbi:DUF4843 domain-containing protein [uncultured Sanguibacteroides sp.]|uniref:DUF4843 domain-containing protein n=1 Tax=uncultured Sanguibacteroides sp. TaxID=1635151 RepID=UPI0025FFB94A|nr:DUF4843 domain-containing protein [uncultured Sanguibacteroides sp.]
MRKIGWIGLWILVFCSCGKSEMKMFGGKNYIYFAGRYDQDSVEVSFYFHPNTEVLSVPIHLCVSGDLLTEDKTFVIEADEVSTAEISDYTLPEWKWRAGEVEDSSFRVLLHYSPQLENRVLRLVLKIVENENFLPGDIPYRKKIIRFSALKSKPSWWDDKITDEYLGPYTEKKLDVFMEITGVGDLTGLDENRIRSLAIQFKYKLIEEAEKGNIIQDENGPMYKTVSVSV